MKSNISLIAMLAASVLLMIVGRDWPTFAQQDQQVTETKTQEHERAVPEHTNQLIHETSPYLLQHAHNPVNWHPWGPAAFAKAKAENKPIFLSIGYSTCYWCHVMERESFEQEDVAEILNDKFICIKVDREERPEVDQQYMLATQLMTGRGGWPNSVWLTPEGEPWMAGTYFPKDQFKKALLQLSDFWVNRNDDVLKQAKQLTSAIKKAGVAELAGKPISAELLEKAFASAQQRFDKTNGGFGTAPKFPPHATLAFLINRFHNDKSDMTLDMTETTLTKMAQGGVYDQIGGGFHRYSTDAHWLLPHFEKMLYDNGQLMKSYTDGYLLTSNELHRETVEGIYQWLMREMTSPEGGFYSAVDSESNAEEGQFYVWKYDEVIDVLGEDDGKLFAKVYDIRKNGNFSEEATGQQSKDNVLHLAEPISTFAKNNEMEAVELARRLGGMRERLREFRSKREYPHLDDKVIAAWNGLMIEGLAYAGRNLDEPKYTDAAINAADFILDKMMKDGKLQRTYRAGQAKLNGYLNDYAFVSAGLLELHRATNDPKYLDAARQMANTSIAEFEDKQNGGFYFTTESVSGEPFEFVIRSKNLGGGGNLPNGNGVMAEVLFDLGNQTGQSKYEDAARRTVDGLSGYMWQTAGQADELLVAASSLLNRESEDKSSASGVTTSTSSGNADANFNATAVEGNLYVSKIRLAPSETFRVAIRLSIAKGYHLYGPNAGINVVSPTTVAMNENPSVGVVKIFSPTGTKKMDSTLGKQLETFEGDITFFLDLKIADDAKVGELKLLFTVKTQACDDNQCAAPANNEFEIDVVILPEKAGATPPRHADIFSAADN